MSVQQHNCAINSDVSNRAATVFLLFAFPYLMSAALRSINAVIAPDLVREFGLSAAQLGLLSALYFLGFTAVQLPLGGWLDRYGPRRVEAALLLVCLAGVALFATAQSVLWLSVGRLLVGVGVSACLMAPYTGYRHWFAPDLRARLSTWMLMTGSLGMVVSSAPVQLAVPHVGWRGVFWLAFGLVAASAVLLWNRAPELPSQLPSAAPPQASYRAIFSSRTFVAYTPFFVIIYGGLLGVQTLWIGPWFTRVAGMNAAQASWAVLAVHAAMGVAFLSWGLALPRLTARGWSSLRLIRAITPLALVLWALVIVASPYLSLSAVAALWALAFVAISVASQSQVTISQQFDAALAGRVNTASNLLIFVGAFALQWLVGVWADAFQSHGYSAVQSLQAALGLLLGLMVLAYFWLIFQMPTARRATATAPASV